MGGFPMIPPLFLQGLTELSVDASSLIYLLKTGLLGSLAAEVELLSTPQVIKETEWPHLPVRAVDVLQDEDGEPVSNDESVVVLAQRRKIPVLSEDYEVLMHAGSLGLEYYNTLMILNYLLLKKRITPDEYPEYLERLKNCSHYSVKIMEQGALVHDAVLKYIESHA